MVKGVWMRGGEQSNNQQINQTSKHSNPSTNSLKGILSVSLFLTFDLLPFLGERNHTSNRLWALQYRVKGKSIKSIKTQTRIDKIPESQLLLYRLTKSPSPTTTPHTTTTASHALSLPTHPPTHHHHPERHFFEHNSFLGKGKTCWTSLCLCE
jgi:hypothetical protein